MTWLLEGGLRESSERQSPVYAGPLPDLVGKIESSQSGGNGDLLIDFFLKENMFILGIGKDQDNTKK
jgi:hypothetical protein